MIFSGGQVMTTYLCVRTFSLLALFNGLTFTTAKADIVTDWNDVVLEAVTAAREPQPTQARSVAMVHLAMFEAINAIERRYVPYVVKSAVFTVSADAAAASAARAVLSKLYPGQQAAFDKAYTATMSHLPDGADKSSGILLGEQIAQDVYNTRASDALSPQNTYRTRVPAGMYVPTTLPVAAEAAKFKPWLMQN